MNNNFSSAHFPKCGWRSISLFMKTQLDSQMTVETEKASVGIRKERVEFQSRFAAAFAFLALALSLGFSLPATAQADQMGPGAREWASALKASIRAPGPLSKVRIEPVDLTNYSGASIDAYTRGKLEDIANEQVQIWADTILEGDYVADTRVRLDRVDRIFVDGEFVGYRIEYSTAAWDTANCDATMAGSDEDCIRGRIREATFVSPDLSFWFRDDKHLAEFK